MTKILAKASKKNRTLKYDEPTSLQNYEEKVALKDEKQKELDKEMTRIKIINDKLKEYNLSITEEEIQDTFKRLNEYSNWVDITGCKFHTVFLKVMEFEMERDRNIVPEIEENYFEKKEMTAN